MSGKAIWKGHIRFRDFDIPVKLHTAVREERIQFHLLHARDRVRLKQEMVCAYEKVPVPAEEQVRGFRIGEGKYILVEAGELEETEPEESRVIEVREFVRAEEIDPVYIERVYYLEPDLYTKGYAALTRVLTETGLRGICAWAMRRRSYVGALATRGGILCLNTLRYADEMVPVKTLELENLPLSEKELSIGMELINRLSAPFEPGKFENEHQKKLRDLIDKKIRGEKVAVLRPRQLKATDSDKLLKALEASLKRVA